MSHQNPSIERNVMTVAAIGGTVFLALLVTLFIIQRNLGSSIENLSQQVIPLQSELGELTDAVGSMYLGQSEVMTASVEELQEMAADDHAEKEVQSSQQRLGEMLKAPAFFQHPQFPTTAVTSLESEVTAFLETRARLFEIAQENRAMHDDFEQSKSNVESDLKRLLHQSASISGILRLNYILKLRGFSQTLDQGQVDEETATALIYGDSRTQMEAIESFNLAAQRLDVLVGRIAAAANIDVMNSLAANQVAQNRAVLQDSLLQIERLVKGDQYRQKLSDLKRDTNHLIMSVADDSSDSSLFSKRRSILISEANLIALQRKTADSANALQVSTTALMAFSEGIAEKANLSADKTIHFSWTATLTISTVGILLAVIASLRIRTSVFALRAQNEKLSALSKDLAEVNRNLEHTVQQRTASLQLVLDSTGDGIFAVDMDGTLMPERSQPVTNWFGDADANTKFWDYLANGDSELSVRLWMGFDQIAADVFPFDVAVDQAPDRISVDDKTFELGYRDVREDGQLHRILIVVRDITAKLEAERAEQAVKDLHHVIENLLKDRDGFSQSVEECDELITELRSSEDRDVSRRLLHTIKGNSAIIGFRRVAEFVHDLETHLQEDERLPYANEIDQIASIWSEEIDGISMFLENTNADSLSIDNQDVAEVIDLLQNRAVHSEILQIVSAWQHEPVSVPIERLANQAKRLAEQTGKPINMSIDDGGLRFPSAWLSPFWPTMIHVVRNAVDHGLETPEERVERQKPAEGKLEINCDVVNGWLQLEFSDDGKGIDWDTVREKALAKGVSSETSEDLIEAIFSDGLSTRDDVTALSGRGVGLGAVREACEKLGGSLSVSSTLGSGTTFAFRFPVPKETPFSTEEREDGTKIKTRSSAAKRKV